MTPKPKQESISAGPSLAKAIDAYPSGDEIREYVAAHHSSFGRLLEGYFEFKTHAEAEKLSSMLALNTPDPARASLGFWELFSNAVEHGNLGIDMDEKARLMLNGRLMEEIDRRQLEEPYCDRCVRVHFCARPAEVTIRVVDQGEGFDHLRMLSFDPSPDRPNGRGIQMALQMCFDSLRYEGNGNVVEGRMQFPKE